MDLGSGPAHDGRGPGGRRGRGHPARPRAQASSTRSSRPRTRGSAWGWPSATASSRSIGAPSRSDSAEGRGTDRHLLPPDRALTAMTPVTARILIADDEDSLRWVLEKGLRGAGYEVTVGEGRHRRAPRVRGRALRPRPPRRAHAGRRTASPLLEPAARDPRPDAQRRGHDRARHDGDRHPGHAAGRLRLPGQALRPRRGAAARRARARPRAGSPRRWRALKTRAPGGLGVRRARRAPPAHAGGLQDDRARRRQRRDACSCAASRARARRWSRARIHHYSRRAGRPFVAVSARGHPRHAARVRAVRPRAAAPSPTPRSGGSASSSWPTAARSSSTRSATCRSSCRSSCCARCRSGPSSAWAATSRSASTCACSPPPTATSRR